MDKPIADTSSSFKAYAATVAWNPGGYPDEMTRKCNAVTEPREIIIVVFFGKTKEIIEALYL